LAEQKTFYGGQAVIEGVMMRGKKTMVTAVRRPNGEIGLNPQPLQTIYTGRLRKTPFIRGIIALIESMVLGIQTLMYSANIALEEEQEKMSGWILWVTIAASLAFSVVLFFLVPLFLTNFIKDRNTILQSTILFNVVDGIIRVIIFIIYLKVISMMKDIKRVFGYHGSEHKSINAYEAGVPLNVDSVRPFSTANPRCGTSFLFAVLVIAIFVFSLIGKPSLAWMAVSRVVLLPVIAALSYEFIFFTARHCSNPFMKVLLTPGLWLQALTTREPDDKQLEVGIAALKKVLEIEEPQKYPPAPETAPLTPPSELKVE
jgi:uncharacterized protein YqhQ